MAQLKSGSTVNNKAIVVTDDSRLSDARTPTSHVHGNITNDGKIGTTSGLMVKTTTSGALTTLAAGSAGQFLRYDGTWDTPPDNNTVYTHPTGFTNQPGTALTGSNVISQVTVNTEGHVTGITSRALTPANISAEPAITKNTAFNKNYGTTATDVKMNGTQAVGILDEIARIDHVHPTDTSRAAVTDLHTHTNKAVLDLLTDSSGQLLYNGTSIGIDLKSVTWGDFVTI